MLRAHGEDELAERVLLATDDEFERVGRLAWYYAFSKDALALGGSMGGRRAFSLAALDVFDGSGRELRVSRTDWELEVGPTEGWAEQDALRDRALRANADREQHGDPRPGS
jgi:hypothetical protein